MNRGERVAPSRRTFDDLADEWFGQLRVGERTRERYEQNLRLHLKPRLGRCRAHAIKVDDIASLIAALEKAGMEVWTIRNMLTTPPA
jgi:Phage integrase, N-terminal SAM-like domain